MIHPSYVELMNIVNEGSAVGEEPVVNSRYSIVCATAKRARQLTNGAEPLIDVSEKDRSRSLLIAVEELYQGKLKILTPEEAVAEQARVEAEAEERRRQAEELRREAEAALERERAAAAENGDDEFIPLEEAEETLLDLAEELMEEAAQSADEDAAEESGSEVE